MAHVQVLFDQDRNEATIEYTATNAVTAGFVSSFLGLAALLPFAIGIAAVVNGRVDIAVVCVAITAGAMWAIRRFIWIPKPYRIDFTATGFDVNGQHFDYDDITSHGVSRFGGDIYDPGSMPVPRNSTVGPHVFIVLNSDPRQRPVTVNMPRDQAKRVAEEFDRVLAFFANRPDEPD